MWPALWSTFVEPSRAGGGGNDFRRRIRWWRNCVVGQFGKGRERTSLARGHQHTQDLLNPEERCLGLWNDNQRV